MAVITPIPKTQFIGADGIPLVGGKVYTYQAGTTNPQPTYTDSTGSEANTNPIILDSRGEANIWLGEATYKFKLTDANDVEQWTVDYISAPTTALSPVLSGNVTISSDSSGAALKITQTGTGPALLVQDSVDPDTTPFTITASGLVGIGTNAPLDALDVSDGAIYLSSSGSARASIAASSTLTTLTSFGARAFRFIVNGITSIYANDSGYVGVLNTTPTVPLDVTGAIKASGAATFGGNTSVTGTLTSTGNISSSAGSVTANTSVTAGTSVTATTSVITDTISERTAAANVTVNGVPVVYNSGTSYISGDYLRLASKTVTSTTSGTSVTYTIPSWARRITVLFNSVSLNGNDDLLVKIGTGSGSPTFTSLSVFLTSGASAGSASSTVGFAMVAGAAVSISGTMTIALIDSATYTYVSSHTTRVSTTTIVSGGGHVSLSGLATQLVIAPSGANAFDAGSVNILYE